MLARQFLTASLVVALPGTLAVGAVTLYVLVSLGAVDAQLTEITRSLHATRELQLAVGRAERHLTTRALLGGSSREPGGFDRSLAAAEAGLASCASAPCHGASQTPREMAALLGPAIERLKRDGQAILGSTPGAGRHDRPSIEALAPLFAGIDRELDWMSSGLERRVDDLGTRVVSVRRRALLLTGALTLAIVTAAAGVAMAAARRIARPLREVVAGTRRIVAGDWYHRVPVRAPGEVAEVASSFNAMMAELCAHRERIEQDKLTLERRVQERSHQLRQVERALERSERIASVGRLAAELAHRLNNPLTTVVMTAGLLLEEVGAQSPIRDDLRKIVADAHRCSHLIDELRLFASPDPPRRAPSSVRAVVDRALSSTERELQDRRVRVDLDLDPDLPGIEWDADQMVQVLVSLVMNAAQAMPDGGQLRVRARQTGGLLVLEIHDSGTGIPAEHRQRIFDPFFTTRQDGTGLGLPISQRIVHDHGGDIEVESRTRDEHGATGDVATTVRIVLPIAPAPDRGGTRVSGRDPVV